MPISLGRMLLLQWSYAVVLLIYATRSLRRIAANDRAKPKTVLRLDHRGRAPGGRSREGRRR